MAVFQVESGVAHGRGFSAQDPNGYCAKVCSWIKRPAADGTSNIFTADPSTDIFSLTAHGYLTGDEICFTTSDTLPSPLTISTIDVQVGYYVIKINNDTFKVASTYANAISNTPIDITTAGTGTHRVYKRGGGPSWYIFDDCTDVSLKTFTVDSATDIITCTGHGYGTGFEVQVSNLGGGLPGGLSAGTSYFIRRIDANTFKLTSDYSGAFNNNNIINITSSGTGTQRIQNYNPFIVFCDTISPVVNDISTGPSGGPPKFIKVGYRTVEAGYIRVQFLTWWSTSVRFGYGYWTGLLIGTYDDADFAYNFRGGAEFICFASREGSTWFYALWDEFVGDLRFLEGTDKNGVIQSLTGTGSNVTIQLGTGQAVNFTANKYYYIFDFNDTTHIEYVKIISRDTGTDQIIVNTINSAFAANSRIAAYAHRWYSAGNTFQGYPYNEANMNNGNYTYYQKIPYQSSKSYAYVTHDQFTPIEGRISFCVGKELLETINPNDEGETAVQRPGISEYSRDNSTGTEKTDMNRAYGVTKNLYITRTNNMLRMQDGRVINSKNYIYLLAGNECISLDSNYAGVILDTESTS